MLGLLFGTQASPVDAPFTPNPLTPNLSTIYPTLEKAYNKLSDTAVVSKNYTDEFSFLADNTSDGFYSVPISFENIGVRLGALFTARSGFGFSIKTGFSHYKQDPTFNNMTGEPNQTFLVPPTEGDRLQINTLLMDSGRREEIARELGFDNDFELFSHTSLEDTHMQLHWTYPITLTNDKKVRIVDVIPYFALGTWLPTGSTIDQNNAFSLPVGNDGFAGVTLEAALHFGFPDPFIKDSEASMVIGFGGAITLFDSRTLENYRVPSSIHQSTLFPWQTTVKRRLGTTWNLYASLIAYEFIKGLSFFANYIFVRHERDSFSLQEQNKARADFFRVGVLEDISLWYAQYFYSGLRYAITKNLAFGLGVQSQITGSRVYRTTTVLGTVNFSF